MKNKAILLIALLTFGSSVFAQDNKFKLGIRLAPGFAFNQIKDAADDDNIKFESNGLGLRFSAGLFGDFHFGKFYAFHSGLWYTVKRSGVQFSSSDGTGKAIYNLQSLQVPIALKLFTSEISTDLKMYFTLGGTLDIIINEKRLEWTSDYIGKNQLGEDLRFTRPGEGKAFGVGDLGLLLGWGIEFQMAESTTLFGGLVYNRGLTNPVSKDGIFPGASDGKDSKDYFTLNNQFLGIEVGIKF